MRRLALALTLVVTAAVPAAARADTLAVPAPGAVNLAAGGGYLVWAAPGEDTGWRLVVRAPGGGVSTPAVRGFPGPPDAAIGSDAFAAGRRLLAVYSRASGGDQDVYALDLRTGREERIAPISSNAYDETVPSVQYGRFAFVRSGGRRDGVYAWNGDGPSRRLSSYEPRELATSESRVAYAGARTVVVRRLSGEGRALVLASPARPRSLTISRYRTTWLGDQGQVFRTPRYAGSGGPYDVDSIETAQRTLPPSTQSAALNDLGDGWFLDGEGVKSVAPRLTYAG